jgi:hypothetical protein
MRPRQIRFSDAGWALIVREARGAGVSAAQFIREAAYARAFLNIGLRGAGGAQALTELYGRDLDEIVRRFVSDEPRPD